jgi:hypothetical protein
MSNLPQEKPQNYSDRDVRQFFNKYFSETLSFPSSQVDAVVNFFTKRGFEETAAVSTATVLLEQSKIDNVNVFKLLDTLKGLNNVQLSAVCAEILNYNRPKTSSLGYKRPIQEETVERRNIAP